MGNSDREADLLEALGGTAKSALSIIPGLAQAISGWDAYRRSQFDRQVLSAISYLTQKVDDIEALFESEWFRSEEGQQFARKVIDCALDAQIEEKQELFINALIQGIEKEGISTLERYKFVDMLRHMSKASLMVLADIHNLFIDQVRGPGRSQDQTSALPHIDANRIAENLSHKYHPYLVTAAISELESHGLFSKTGNWRMRPDGGYAPDGGLMTDLCYTDFSARFVEFITMNNAGTADDSNK